MSPASAIRLVIAEDHGLVLDGLVAVLRQAPDMEVVGAARDGAEAIEVCRQARPDLLLLDLRLPVLDGLSVVEALRREGMMIRTLLMSSYEGSEMVLRGLRAGARGFVAKNALAAELVAAIRVVHSGGMALPASLQERMLGPADAAEALSSRKIEILRLVAEGRGNAEIAAILGISPSTAKNHMVQIMTKLGALDRTHAVVLAIKAGLLDVDE